MNMNAQQINRLATRVISAVAALVVVPIVLVILFVVVQGAGTISWEFLTAPPTDGMTAGGIGPALLGTVLLTMGSAVVAMPLAVPSQLHPAGH